MAAADKVREIRAALFDDDSDLSREIRGDAEDLLDRVGGYPERFAAEVARVHADVLAEVE